MPRGQDMGTQKQSRLFAYLPLVIFAAVCGVLLAGLFLGDPSRLPSALRGKVIADFTLPDLMGSRGGLTIADLKMGKPTILNIWASWCAPCRTEHPLLMALARQGVVIFGLNYKDEATAARRFIGHWGNPYTRIGMDRSGSVALNLSVYGVPETYIISGQGEILFRHVGALTQNVVAEKILPLLSEQKSQR